MLTLGTPRREAQVLVIEPVRKLNWPQAVRFGARSPSGAATTAMLSDSLGCFADLVMAPRPGAVGPELIRRE
jgi:hypothetical protein